MQLSNVKLLYKIIGCFLLLSVVVGFGVWFAASKMEEINRTYASMLENEVQGMKANFRANARLFNFGRMSWRIIAETDPAEMQKLSREITANHKEFSDFIAQAKKGLPQFAADFDRIDRMFDDMMTKEYPRSSRPQWPTTTSSRSVWPRISPNTIKPCGTLSLQSAISSIRS
ncbi:MCP four helix bundle domain-containing protein [Rhodopseudomonas sp. P1]